MNHFTQAQNLRNLSLFVQTLAKTILIFRKKDGNFAEKGEKLAYQSVSESEVSTWFRAAPLSAFPADGGACVRYKNLQIAIFNFAHRGEWYATQNLSPHCGDMVIARGMIGSEKGEPKVACPLYKKTYSLVDGRNLNGEAYSLATYPVKVENGFVYIGFSE